MILYKETFPLGKNKSFSSYIKKIDEGIFSPYTLLITEIDKAKKYRVEISLSESAIPLGTVNSIFGGTLLNVCTIQYLKEERVFILSASAKYTALFLCLFYVIVALGLLTFALVMISVKNISPNTIFPIIGVILAIIAPVASLYLQERRFLDRLGSLGSEL